MPSTIVKTKVFFEKLDRCTTEESLGASLSKEYQIQTCFVPSESGQHKRYGSVVFTDEAYVNKLMNNRPIKIDGRPVEVYRSVPGEGPLKEKIGVTTLIVNDIKNKLTKENIQEYFQNKYGKVENISTNEDNGHFQVEFADYDSVDKALLDKPHQIKSVSIDIKKGNRRSLQPVTTEAFDPQPSIRKYRIHVTNLSLTSNANDISKLFNNWPIRNILMRSTNHQDSSTECWLIDIHDLEVARDFVRKWNGSIHNNLSIQCCDKVDTTDLCKYFQVGHCNREADKCDWQHITCPNYSTCSAPNCAYGHSRQLPRTMIESDDSYRIKITGFQTDLTSELLANLLKNSNNKYYINPHDKKTGYVIKLKSIKSAQGLFEKWHGRTLEGGHTLQCQLETNTVPPHCASTRDSSCSRDSTDSGIMACQEPRPSSQLRFITNSSNDSSKLTLPSTALNNQWEITKKANESSRVLLIREKSNRKHLAAFKACENNNERQALTILKDMDNVSQLIDYSTKDDNRWVMIERAPGLSLEEFIQRKDNRCLDILQAVQLAQKILAIIKCVHSNGVFHGNIQPKHIMIEQTQLTIISFSNAHIKSETISCSYSPSKQSWYRPQQSNAKGSQWLASIDATSICALLFWLITDMMPTHDDDGKILPHQQDNARNRLETEIASQCSKKKKSDDVKRLTRYLNDTFSHAFGYPDYPPWTIDDLEGRLESICELISHSVENSCSIEEISHRMLSIEKVSKQLLPRQSIAQQNIFAKASYAFAEAKEIFHKFHYQHYSWSNGDCIWLSNPYNPNDEHQNYDTLLYRESQPNIVRDCRTIVVCLASFLEKEHMITFSIGSPVNGKMLRFPIGQYSIDQDYEEEFRDNFLIELKHLLLAVYKESKLE